MAVRRSQVADFARGHHVAPSQADQMEASGATHSQHEEARFKGLRILDCPTLANSNKCTEIHRKRFLAWLAQSSVKFDADQRKIDMARLEETGVWLLEADAYIRRKEKPESELLWVNGKRGCEKSFLASAVVQDLKTRCQSVENMEKEASERSALAFIYCSSLDPGKQDTSKLLCSLVEQLCHQLPAPDIDPYLQRIYDHFGETRPLYFDEIKRALELLLCRFRVIYLVIDGLDELRILDTQFAARCEYFRRLTQLGVDDTAVKLVAFSRPEYFAISSAFDGCPQVFMDNGANDTDIKRFIGNKLATSGLEFQQSPDILEDIIWQLLVRAEGMFLWVDLVMHSLKDERTAAGLREKVRVLPRGLDVQYGSSLRKIVANGNIRDFALKILLWITNAMRPLRRDELLEALAVEPGMTELYDDDRILYDDFCEICQDLIVLDRRTENTSF